jgi:hypothetical protein
MSWQVSLVLLKTVEALLIQCVMSKQSLTTTIFGEKTFVYIFGFNEAEKVAPAIESVRRANEIVLVNSSSTDGTPGIATKFGARVVQVDL